MTRFFTLLALTVVVLILLAFTGLLLLNQKLPALIERELNAHVKGYQFRVGQATLSPTLSLEIQQLTMIQTDIPIRRSQKSPSGA
jgi:hypothetical protein